MKGLIVRKEFIDLILSGKKGVEIRSYRTKYRGPVVLIWRGKAYGVVDVVDVLPFKEEKSLSNEERDFLSRYGGRKLYMWVLKNPRKLKNPVDVKVPKGAIVWVKIDEDTRKRIEEVLA